MESHFLLRDIVEREGLAKVVDKSVKEELLDS
jgi:hypothetical protein